MSNLPDQPDETEELSRTYLSSRFYTSTPRGYELISPDTVIHHLTSLVRKSADGLRALGLRLESEEDIHAVVNVFFTAYQQRNMTSTPGGAQVNQEANPDTAMAVDSDPAPAGTVTQTAAAPATQNGPAEDPMTVNLKVRRANPNFKPEHWARIFPRFGRHLLNQCAADIWGEAAAMTAVRMLYRELPPDQWCSWPQWRTQITYRELYYGKKNDNNLDYIEWCVDTRCFRLNPVRSTRHLGENNPAKVHGSTTDRILTSAFRNRNFDLLNQFSDMPARSIPNIASQAAATDSPAEAGDDSLFVDSDAGNGAVDTAVPSLNEAAVDAAAGILSNETEISLFGNDAAFPEDIDLTFGDSDGSDLSSATDQNAANVSHVNVPTPIAAFVGTADSPVATGDISLNGGNRPLTAEEWAALFNEGNSPLRQAMEESFMNSPQPAHFTPSPTPAGMGDSFVMTQSPSPFIEAQAPSNQFSSINDVCYGMMNNSTAYDNIGLDVRPFQTGPPSSTDFMTPSTPQASVDSLMYVDGANVPQAIGQLGQSDPNSNGGDSMTIDPLVDPVIMEQYNRRMSKRNNQ